MFSTSSPAEEKNNVQSETEPSASLSSALQSGQKIDMNLVEQSITMGVDAVVLAHQAAMTEVAFCTLLKKTNPELFDKLPHKRRTAVKVNRTEHVDTDFLNQCSAMGFHCRDLAILNPTPVSCTDVAAALGIKSSRGRRTLKVAADPAQTEHWLTTEDLLLLLGRVSPTRLAEVLCTRRRGHPVASAWATFLEKVRDGDATAAENPLRASRENKKQSTTAATSAKKRRQKTTMTAHTPKRRRNNGRQCAPEAEQ